MTSEVVMAGTGASGLKAGKVFMFSVGRDVSRFAYKLIRLHQSCLHDFFSNLLGKQKLVQKIGNSKKSWVKLQRLTEEGKQLLVRLIGRVKN